MDKEMIIVFSRKRLQLNNNSMILKRIKRLCQANPPKNFQRNKATRPIRVRDSKEKLKTKPQTNRVKQRQENRK